MSSSSTAQKFSGLVLSPFRNSGCSATTLQLSLAKIMELNSVLTMRDRLR